MIRESPTEPSRGMTTIHTSAVVAVVVLGAVVQSFFDIFLEVSTDGGGSWQPATAPARMEAESIGPESAFPTDHLPPPEGEYVSPQRWHALFAQGIVISNVIHRQFTAVHFAAGVGPDADAHIRLAGGDGCLDGLRGDLQPCQCAGDRDGELTGAQNDGTTRFFDTEMLELTISSGLPGGPMIRESPTRASHGRTSVRANGTDNDCDSFFDIFIEVSTDGGQNWQVPTTGPATVTLRPLDQDGDGIPDSIGQLPGRF